jgi:hypothetical protein
LVVLPTAEVFVPFEVPKAVVQGTPLSPESLRTLGHMLRVEVRMQRSRIAGDRPLEVLADPQPDPKVICPRCSTPIAPGESVGFEHGEVFHLEYR